MEQERSHAGVDHSVRHVGTHLLGARQPARAAAGRCGPACHGGAWSAPPDAGQPAYRKPAKPQTRAGRHDAASGRPHAPGRCRRAAPGSRLPACPPDATVRRSSRLSEPAARRTAVPPARLRHGRLYGAETHRKVSAGPLWREDQAPDVLMRIQRDRALGAERQRRGSRYTERPPPYPPPQGGLSILCAAAYALTPQSVE